MASDGFCFQQLGSCFDSVPMPYLKRRKKPQKSVSRARSPHLLIGIFSSGDGTPPNTSDRTLKVFRRRRGADSSTDVTVQQVIAVGPFAVLDIRRLLLIHAGNGTCWIVYCH